MSAPSPSKLTITRSTIPSPAMDPRSNFTRPKILSPKSLSAIANCIKQPLNRLPVITVLPSIPLHLPHQQLLSHSLPNTLHHGNGNKSLIRHRIRDRCCQISDSDAERIQRRDLQVSVLGVGFDVRVVYDVRLC
ncbi:hypothetical protein Droror1_Dr00019929 [Drosera rotundifolia]